MSRPILSFVRSSFRINFQYWNFNLLELITILKVYINRGYLLFRGEYQIYFIECVENIRIFMSAQHERNFGVFNSQDEIYLVFTKKK